MIRKKWTWDVQAMTLDERSLLYTWRAIIQRCTNPKCKLWPDYGGRGIFLAPEFLDFSAFAAEIGTRPAKGYDIDRIDNNKGYEPGNIRWLTHHKNMLNCRSNRLVTIKGVTKHFSEWADQSGMNRGNLHYRLTMGWPEERLFDPPTKWGRALSSKSKTKKEAHEEETIS